MRTIADNINILIRKNGYSKQGIDLLMGWAKGTLSVKLNRNKKNLNNGFTVGDIGRLKKLFDCRADAFFDGVFFEVKDTNE